MNSGRKVFAVLAVVAASCASSTGAGSAGLADTAANNLSAPPVGRTGNAGPPLPSLGSFEDETAITAALKARVVDAGSGSIEARPKSICADIVTANEPAIGAFVYEAIAVLRADTGVVFVLRDPDGAFTVRMYSTGTADPDTGGCRLMFEAPLT